MSFDINFTLTEKENGLYGNLDYTWNFDTHTPMPTLEYIQDHTGYSLESLKGTTELALIEIKKVNRLSKIESFKGMTRQDILSKEFIIAHDEELIYDFINYQIEIFEAGFNDGGWLSMYETTDEYGLKSTIGMAAEHMLLTSPIGSKKINYTVDSDLVRVGY